jgi:hypothetical protein
MFLFGVFSYFVMVTDGKVYIVFWLWLIMVNETEYRRSKAFLREVDDRGFGRSREDKIDLLRLKGYDVLNGKGGVDILLDDCSTSQLSQALINTYNAESNKTIDFERDVKSSDRYRSISGLFEAEKGLEGDSLEDAMERTSIALNDASNRELFLLGREFNVDLSGFYVTA